LNGTGTALNWTAPATVSAGSTVTYTVQRTTDGGVTWTPLALPAPGTARTLAITTPVGANYQYRVAAQATRFGLATSALGSWTTTAVLNRAPAVSTTPTAAAGVAGSRQITVSWTNPSTNITGFTVQRSLGAAVFANMVPQPTWTKNGTTYSFVDTLAASGGSYRYRLLATSAGGSTVNTAASTAVVAP
jgi:hypothetical protein